MRAFFMILTAALLILPGCSGGSRQRNVAEVSRLQDLPAFSTDDLHRRTFNYFWELSDSVTGLVPDRYPTQSFSSIAAVGFGLTAYLVGVEHDYISRQQAAVRVLKILRFFWSAPQGPGTTGITGYHGLFYHFLDMRTGYRFRDVELSTIDTGLLMAGILSCMTYFDGDSPEEQEIRDLADRLYRRAEWDWAFLGNHALSMGWHPESGFINSYWDGYTEAMILLVMAIASPTHPIPASYWQSRYAKFNWSNWYGYEHVNFGPLFGHQYSHIYIDFRDIRDEYMRSKGTDYFENSRMATLAQQAYGRANPLGFKGYSDSVWGLTACDGPGDETREYNGRMVKFMGYAARGTASDYQVDDGTIAPTAAGGSIPFAPEICLATLESIYNTFGNKVYREYGFIDAFNPSYTWGKGNEHGWFDVDYIGIDQGPILLMLENYRTGFIWTLMKRNPYIRDGLIKAGFTGGWLENK